MIFFYVVIMSNIIITVCTKKFTFIEEYREHLQSKILNKNSVKKEKEILEEIEKITQDNSKKEAQEDEVFSDLKFGSFRCFHCPDTYNRAGNIKGDSLHFY